MAEPSKDTKPEPPPKVVPKWWWPFRLFGRTIMFLFFLVVVLLPIVVHRKNKSSDRFNEPFATILSRTRCSVPMLSSGTPRSLAIVIKI